MTASPDDPTGIWDLLIKAAAAAGPFGTLLTLFFWWRGDKERKEAVKSKDTALEDRARMAEDGIKAMNKVTNVLSALEKAVTAKRRRRRRT